MTLTRRLRASAPGGKSEGDKDCEKAAESGKAAKVGGEAKKGGGKKAKPKEEEGGW